MKPPTRIIYTDDQKALMWDRWQQGDSMHDIARLFDRYHSSVQRMLTENGGICPRERKRSRLALSLAERKVISRRLAQRLSLCAIARQLHRSPSTISRETQRNDVHTAYRASNADSAAWERGLRPKICKFTARPQLAKAITTKLQLEWSPEQIAGWLKK